VDTLVFVLIVRFCRSHQTIMGVRALAVAANAVAVADQLFGVVIIIDVIVVFFCGNLDG
jgi:hypothetical protein